jgi:hypothetical protein
MKLTKSQPIGTFEEPRALKALRGSIVLVPVR